MQDLNKWNIECIYLFILTLIKKMYEIINLKGSLDYHSV